MDKFRSKFEKIKDERTHIWNAFLISLGGTLSLLTNLNTHIKAVLFVLGAMLSVFLFIVYFNKDDQLEDITKKMGKE